MALIKLYPKKANMGGELASQGWLVPEKLVPIYLKNGFEREISIENTQAVSELFQMTKTAQEQLILKSSAIDEEREKLRIEREEFEKEKSKRTKKVDQI
jgi:hypothetical protein